MGRRAIAFIISAWALGGVPLFATVVAEPPGPSSQFVWWSVGKAVRLPDGRTEQALALEAMPAAAIEKPEAWIRVMAPGSYRSRSPIVPVWHGAEWLPGHSLIVQSSKYATVDVFARAEIGGRSYFAQTRPLKTLAP